MCATQLGEECEAGMVDEHFYRSLKMSSIMGLILLLIVRLEDETR